MGLVYDVNPSDPNVAQGTTIELTRYASVTPMTTPGAPTIQDGGTPVTTVTAGDTVDVQWSGYSCAAGTGSFLDHQSARLGIPIEDFGSYALKSGSPAHIAGRCSVFAESDMIHKQQVGHRVEDILYGLSEALARNFINNLGLAKRSSRPSSSRAAWRRTGAW